MATSNTTMKALLRVAVVRALTTVNTAKGHVNTMTTMPISTLYAKAPLAGGSRRFFSATSRNSSPMSYLQQHAH
jgi:hypothetical protein